MDAQAIMEMIGITLGPLWPAIQAGATERIKEHCNQFGKDKVDQGIDLIGRIRHKLLSRQPNTAALPTELQACLPAPHELEQPEQQQWLAEMRELTQELRALIAEQQGQRTAPLVTIAGNNTGQMVAAEHVEFHGDFHFDAK
ncbi:MAG: hypothetical protein HQM01_13770 [Magnetococcales bacterium]|nr:hypothetical protein [Magnetococcales bacterium]